eukprot:2156180-Pyramimonas_sp.AAC.1
MARPLCLSPEKVRSDPEGRGAPTEKARYTQHHAMPKLLSRYSTSRCEARCSLEFARGMPGTALSSPT